MKAALIIACVVTFLWGMAHKAALKGLGIFYKKKGYTQPTDEELRECSLEAIKQMFHLK